MQYILVHCQWFSGHYPLNGNRGQVIYTIRQTRPSLNCLFGANPLSEPMLVYCKVDRWHQIPMKNTTIVIQENEPRLQNVDVALCRNWPQSYVDPSQISHLTGSILVKVWQLRIWTSVNNLLHGYSTCICCINWSDTCTHHAIFHRKCASVNLLAIINQHKICYAGKPFVPSGNEQWPLSFSCVFKTGQNVPACLE